MYYVLPLEREDKSKHVHLLSKQGGCADVAAPGCATRAR